MVAHLQVALDGLVSNCYYTGKRVKVTGQMVSSNFAQEILACAPQ